MIQPGFRRRNDVCPLCHMPGRVGQRDFLAQPGAKPAAQGEDFPPGYPTNARTLSVIFPTLKMNVSLDICDNCGIIYVVAAE